MKKSREKMFSRGNKINISIIAYATIYNRYLVRIKSNKEIYSFDKVKQQTQDGKGPRPIIIIWSNKYHEKIIACSESTKENNYKNKYSFSFIDESQKKKYWNYEVLVLNKDKTKIINNHIWYKYSNEKIEFFLNEWKNQHNAQVSYNYLEKLMLKFDNEAKQHLIDKLLNERTKHSNKNQKNNRKWK